MELKLHMPSNLAHIFHGDSAFICGTISRSDLHINKPVNDIIIYLMKITKLWW